MLVTSKSTMQVKEKSEQKARKQASLKAKYASKQIAKAFTATNAKQSIKWLECYLQRKQEANR